MPDRPHVVCLTPVRNEARFLPAFLAAAATWADGIVIVDHARPTAVASSRPRTPRSSSCADDESDYDEGRRVRLLFDAARAEFPEPRVLVKLDADEALTAGATATAGWAALLAAPPGTGVRMRWLNLLPDGTTWVDPSHRPFALVDDAGDPDVSLHPREKMRDGAAPPLVLDDVAVVHLQHLDPANMKSKQRWYQAWNRVQLPDRRPRDVYRQFHWMDALDPAQLVATDPAWLAGYEAAGIALTPVAPVPEPTWQDVEVARLMDEHGTAPFRRTDLFDHDWRTAAAAVGCPAPVDPRSALDRSILRVLARTQGRRRRPVQRVFERAIALVGW